ncbi:glycosyltransferase family 4 protein [Ceraceosorus bombacis]|uniref:GDP-Man:Man(3)GlcNAc(2)-PP-Dol alpha-1,2-mannosyltransferase n=1 Tax=Ceraceosorus bombacis TaxID=401625 RepID=A0A0P1BD15_9BASI|nr:glycosyltransferase family 4 protein [Ceraceosorus bombacis]
MLLAVLSAVVFSLQFVSAHIRNTKKANKSRRRELLERAGITDREERNKKTIVGFFHPYCNAGGGGERVLFQALLHHLETHQDHVLVIYTGDVGIESSLRHLNRPWNGMGTATPAEILERCTARFGIPLSTHPRRHHIQFLPLKSRAMVGDSYWKRLTLLGQSYGSVRMAIEAIGEVLPDVWIDTMGYAFSYPTVRAFSSKVRIGAYTHYPTISTDMVSRVALRKATHTNPAGIASSALKSRLKLVYYQSFVWAYTKALRCAHVIVGNGSWTAAHLSNLIGSTQQVRVLYPPCDTSRLTKLSLESRQARTLISLGQFRPEKEHATQLRILRATLDANSNLREAQNPLRLLMIGSSRDATDEARVEGLRTLANELKLTHADGPDHVEFLVNASYDSLISSLGTASIGISTMVDEHFGINVVEFMAAGLITLSHASAGPLLDIAVPDEQGRRTGYHARSVDDFAATLQRILDLPSEEVIAIRQRARIRASETFGADAFCERWEQMMWDKLRLDSSTRPKVQ